MEKNKLLMIIIIVLLVLLLGSIVGVSIFALNAINSANADQGQGQAALPVAPGIEDITYVPLSSSITSNLRTSDDKTIHYIKINISVGINNTKQKDSDALIAKIQENDEAVIRDAVIQILRNKTYESVTDPYDDIQAILKDEIREKLQDTFQTNMIVDIIISEIQY